MRTSTIGRARLIRDARGLSTVEFAVLFIVIYGFVIHAFQYRGALGESDLYRVLVGLMDGASSGQGLASDLHYDRDFGFDYFGFKKNR